MPVPSPFTSPRRTVRLLRTALGRVQESFEAHHAASKLLRHSVAALRRAAARWSLTSDPHLTTLKELFADSASKLAPEEAKLVENQLQLIVGHKLDVLPIDVVLMRTRLDPFEGPHEPDLGWQRVTTGRIKVHILDGLHSDLLTPECAPDIAALMASYLLARRVAPLA